jgi:hypothetical protein
LGQALTGNPGHRRDRNEAGCLYSCQQQIDVAHIAMQINLVKAADRLELPMQREVRILVS